MVKLAIRLFDPNEVSHVQLVVKQLQNRVKDGFTLTNTADADAIIISPNDPGFETLVKSQAGKKQPIVYGLMNTGDYGYFLKKPATTSGLLDLLQRLRSATSLDHSETPQDSTAIVPGPYLAKLFDAGNTELLALEAKGCSILVDSLRRRVVSPKDMIQRSGASAVFRDSVAAAPAVRSSSREEFDEAARNGGNHQLSLDLLIWVVAMATAAQFKIPENTAFKLRHWPDFTKLPYQRSFLKIAAVMTTRAQTLEEVLRTQQWPKAEALSFIAACAALNLLELKPRSDAAPANPPRGRGTDKTIIRKIVNRFFGVVGS